MFTVMETFSPLYKRDTRGKIRVWLMELGRDSDAIAHRTVSGLVDGQKVVSGWKTVLGKSIGRSNETTPEEQARSEIESLYTKQRDRAYFDTIGQVDTFEKFKPMLAHDYAKRGVDWSQNVFAQPKLDGIRCIARSDGLWSRGGKRILAVPHIADHLRDFFEANPHVVLDGELYNSDLKDDFNKIVSLVRKTKPTDADIVEAAGVVQLHVYDMFNALDAGQDFGDRWSEIAALHGSLVGPVLQFVETQVVDNSEELDQLYAQWVEQGYEGQMIRYDTAYENKRSRNLLKRKEFDDAEFTVIRVEEGKGNWAGYIKRFVVDVDGVEVGCGVRGNQETLKDLMNVGQPDWAKVQFFGRTPDGSLRFPVVLDWGYGKRTD